jgi:hypothetical protein
MEDMTEVRQAMYQRGFPVIPVSGKRPPMEKWTELRANCDAIALWPNLYPFARNTGLLCKNFPTIDVDLMSPEPSEAIERLVHARFEDHGMLSARVGLWPKRAFLFITDRPFRKLTLKLIAPNGKGEKIEILGDGEQVVVHGVHPDTKKPYAWSAGTPWKDICAKDLPYLDEPMAREFLRDAAELLTTEYGYKLHEEPRANGGAGDPRASSDWGKLFSNIYTGTDLHESIARLAYSFIATGMSGGAVVARLRSLLEASQAPKDARWQDRYDDIPRAVRSAQEKLEVTLEQEALREAAERRTEQAEQTGAQAEQPQPEQPQPKQQPNILLFHRHGEVDPLESRVWCVEDVIPEIGIGLISGQWGTCKTFNGLELAHCVMTGRPYLGYKIRRQGGVLFFAPENPGEIAPRLDGVLKHKGSKIIDPAPFYWVEGCPPLKDIKTANIIIATAQAVAAEFQERFKLPLALIIIDTIVSGAGYAKEGQDNDAAVTHNIMATMAKVGRALGCFVFGIDHYGKDTSVGTRGSSAKEGDADVIFACLGDKDESGDVSNLRLVFRKRRTGACGEELSFRKRAVEIGVDKSGKPETTLVLDFGDDPNAPPKAAKGDDDWGRSKPVRHLKKVLMSLMAEHGQDIQPFRDGPQVRALKLELVEAEFIKSYPAARKGDDPKSSPKKTKARAFGRAMEDAVDRNVVTTRELHGVDWVWLSRAPTAA